MKPEIKYGLITGAGVCLWITLEYLLGFHTTRMELGQYTGFFSNLIPLTTLFLLLRVKQAGFYDARLNLMTGVGSGLVASFIAGLIVYSFLASYTQFVNPSWIDQTLEWKVAQLRLAQVPEATIRERITLFRDAYTPTGLVMTIIVGTTVMGGLFSLGLTLLLRYVPNRAR